VEVVYAVIRQDAMTGRELDAGRPFLGADLITDGILRLAELHGHKGKYEGKPTN
jgi:hypothetical protein